MYSCVFYVYDFLVDFLVIWRFWLGYGEAFFAVTLGLSSIFD